LYEEDAQDFSKVKEIKVKKTYNKSFVLNPNENFSILENLDEDEDDNQQNDKLKKDKKRDKCKHEINSPLLDSSQNSPSPLTKKSGFNRLRSYKDIFGYDNNK